MSKKRKSHVSEETLTKRRGVIGQGKYGTVNRILIHEDDKESMLCAEKITNENLYIEDDDSRNRSESFSVFGTHWSIVSELLVLNSLSMCTNNIVQLYKVDLNPKNLRSIHILMELGDYNLNHYMYNVRLSIHKLMSRECSHEIRLQHLHQFIQIARDLFHGVDELHQHGFIFLDLTPSNIILQREDENNMMSVRLIDFGLSELQCGWKSFVREKVTWAYRAPELGVHSSRYTELSDIWSVGAVLCELFFFHCLINFQDIDEIQLSERMNQILGRPDKRWAKKYYPDDVSARHQENDQDEFYVVMGDSYQEQERMIHFLNVLIPNRSTRLLIFQFYGYRLTLKITELILHCLQYEPNHRPTGRHLCQWPVFREFIGENSNNGCVVPRNIRYNKSSFTTTYPIHSQITQWLQDFFTRQLPVYYPFFLCLQRTCVRIQQAISHSHVIPIQQSLICECIAVSICLKWFHLQDEYNEKAENLREKLINLCQLSEILFNEQEQIILHKHLNWKM